MTVVGDIGKLRNLVQNPCKILQNTYTVVSNPFEMSTVN